MFYSAKPPSLTPGEMELRIPLHIPTIEVVAMLPFCTNKSKNQLILFFLESSMINGDELLSSHITIFIRKVFRKGS